MKQSRVTERTRKNLIKSYWELYKNNNGSKITVGEICQSIDYERTTFYRYFKDITEIHNKLELEIINGIKEDIKNKNDNNMPGIFFEGFKKFTDKYGEYIAIFHEKGDRSFYNKFKELVKNDVYDYLNFNVKEEYKKEFLFEFMFSSLINSYSYWYRHKKNMDLESFVNFANNTLLNGTKSIFNDNKWMKN